MIKDIRPMVQINDSSIYTFIIVSAVTIIFIFYILKYIYKSYQQKKRDSTKLIFKKISSVNLNNTKQAAYDITYYGRKLLQTKEEKDIFEKLNKQLSQYKYKSEVQNIDKDTQQLYNLFIDTIYKNNTKEIL